MLLRQTVLFFLVLILLNTSIYSQNLSDTQSPDEFIKSKLLNYKNQITTMQGKMVYIIQAQTRIVQSGKFYSQTPDKLRMDFSRPVSTSIIQSGDNKYLKSFNQTKYTKIAGNNTVVNQSDLFGFSALSIYKYSINKDTAETPDQQVGINPTDLPADLTSPPAISPIYYGFQTIGNEGQLCVVINYDKEKDIITSYKLIGNEVMPQTTVRLKSYKEINGINIPHRLEITVQAGAAAVKSIIIIREVIINQKIADDIFIVK